MRSSVEQPSAGTAGSAGQPTAGRAVQTTFDDLGTPLADITFVVVDLETTGGSPANCAITEIGAVKVLGGEVLGEFHTLVNPGVAIPAFISVLTGITDAAVAQAPRIDSVLPAFLEFAAGCTLVAHNAPFDMGFLKAAAEQQGTEWPAFGVLDTARLARRTLDRDEAPNSKLATLAQLFRATTTPSHRALDDARATVDVLHGLFERVGCFGVTTIDELSTFSTRVHPAQQRKRHLADDGPRGPGVYLFRDARQRVLYIGKSVDLRPRVRQYFTAAEGRRRMAEMVAAAEEVVSLPCTTLLEAEVRELRMIAEYKPPYNRRSRFPEKVSYLKLTAGPFPRLSIVRDVKDDACTYLGPFSSRRQAEQARDALHEAYPLRQCTQPLSLRTLTVACILAEMERCGAPCDGRQSVDDYAEVVLAASVAMRVDARPVVDALARRMTPLIADERFEEAVTHRDRLRSLLAASARSQRLRALGELDELVAARLTPEGGWEVAVVRHGRLAAAGLAARGVAPKPFIAALRAGADPVAASPGGFPAASAEEAECLLRWLDSPGVRLVHLDGVWTSPLHGSRGLESTVSLTTPPK
ncbi:MAG: DEDD exonuclease domain-containing protein [Actinomycetia bacterium]|nr:DEDD exonuclease domain-containing protein [Actinomycetes bacterium]